MSQSPMQSNPASSTSEDTAHREVRYQYTNNLAPLLKQLGSSLILSTYQAGKLVVVGVHDDQLQLSFHNFERAMGVAVGHKKIAVGGKDWIYFLKNAPELAAQVGPANSHDACFLIRGAHYTSEISVHELAWGQEQLVVTNTRFSCLCSLDNHYSFVPEWRPPFISALAPEDRCHLNGVALVNGQPKYATVLGQTDTSGGWRPDKATQGCVLEVPTGRVVAQGFAMPHSPRVRDGQLWVLDSGRGEMKSIDLSSGKAQKIAELPGYPRGLALAGQFAFVGLSKVRETATFGNLPICERFDDLKCGLAIVDLQTGKQIGLLEFQSGVDEIFDVQVLPGVRNPFFSGPYAIADGNPPIWTVPPPQS
ncbi:TIGR03032 family protein [Acaryochloris sp. IP29b_bin.148]|uniref:TIGR03032 family protein n=1 Tax=Acaryochloris sp. IP29b_bin.148 TaxID=2969218 RepID=UPI002619ECFA|nr:TIGR03032 family protein [Acaryochloris sp. IP29b_bin.148]